MRQGTRRADLSRLALGAAVEWGFAMSVRGRFADVLLLGARPDGLAYRPEELAQLEDSTRRIGMDLESLRVAELQRSHNQLAQQLALALA